MKSGSWQSLKNGRSNEVGIDMVHGDGPGMEIDLKNLFSMISVADMAILMSNFDDFDKNQLS